jgi:hypothetical protein
MKKLSLLTALLCGIGMTEAATHAVLPGASIQAKINIAVAGDIVAIFGGTYNEDLTINKAIRLVEVSGQQVILTGNITFSNVTNAPPFEGFAFGSSGRGIVLNSTTGMILRNLTGTSSNGITANGVSSIQILNCNLTDVTINGTSTLKLRDSSINSLLMNGTSAECSNSTVLGGINQSAGVLNTNKITVAGNLETSNTAIKTLAFRTIVSGDCILRSNRSWFGYGKTRSIYLRGSSTNNIIIGSEVNRQSQQSTALYMDGLNNKLTLTNTLLHNVSAYYNGQNYTPNQDYSAEKVVEVVANSSSKTVIQNCLISMNMIRSNSPDNAHRGVYSGDPDIFIRNNVFVDCQGAIEAPFGATAENNFMQNGSAFSGGIIPLNQIEGITDFSIIDGRFFLASNSPCINAGTSDPRYNDRDGSRNDIGPSGGPWIDPDGWTTENPVVISFDLSPDMVLEGVDTEVILSEGQAVSAP